MLFLYVFIRSFFDPNAFVCQYTVCATCNCAGGWVFKTVCAWLHVCLLNLSSFHVYTLYTCFSCRGLWVCLLLFVFFFFFSSRLTTVCSIQRGKHDLHLDQSLSDTHSLRAAQYLSAILSNAFVSHWHLFSLSHKRGEGYGEQATDSISTMPTSPFTWFDLIAVTRDKHPSFFFLFSQSETGFYGSRMVTGQFPPRTPRGCAEMDHYVNKDESFQDRGHRVLKASLQRTLLRLT